MNRFKTQLKQRKLISKETMNVQLFIETKLFYILIHSWRSTTLRLERVLKTEKMQLPLSLYPTDNIYLSINQSVYLSFYLSAILSICLSVLFAQERFI
jgi:hypothetical protein